MNPADTALELTADTLDAALAATPVPVLLDLWAPWCQPCLVMAPVLDRIAAACSGRLVLAKVDVERHAAVSKRFRVRGIPTLILLASGVEVARLVGPRSLTELKSFLARHGIEPPAPTAIDADGTEWGAFYGDDGLRSFLLDRLQDFAASGALHRGRVPTWSDGQGTVSAALVRHADPRVFERVSGMPFAFACALEFAGLGTPREVDDVLRAIPAGADLGPIAWDLLRWWLADPVNDWAGAIDDQAIDALRMRWLALSERNLPADQAALAWSALRRDAGALVEPRDPRREIERCVAQLVEELSPPPPPDDAQGWMGALLMRGGYLKYAALVLAHGWSREDLAFEGVRSAWFEARAAAEPDGRFSDGRLAAARAEWKADHADTGYAARAAERDALWPQWQVAQHERIRGALIRLIGAAAQIA